MLLDRAADLALLAIQVAEDQVNLQRIAGRLRRLRQLVDRRIDLVGDQEIEAEHVVRRLARAAAIDPDAVLQLVALPRLADGEADQQRDERDRAERTRIVHHDPAAPDRGTTSSQRPWARSTMLDAARAPRRGRRRDALTQCTGARTSGARVGRRGREPDAAQHRQVQQVVAHVGDVRIVRARRRAGSARSAAELVGRRPARRCGSRAAPRAARSRRTFAPTAGRPTAGALRPDQRGAVADVEALRLDPSACMRTVPSVSTPSTSKSKQPHCATALVCDRHRSDHLRPPQVVQVHDTFDESAARRRRRPT